MARTLANPDRNPSATRAGEDSFENLRSELARSGPALPYNEAAKARIGKLIADAVLPSRIRAPVRRLKSKRDGPR
jgi:hypothetical protein